MNTLVSHRHNRNVLATLPLPGRIGKPSVDDIYPRIFDAILEQRIAPASRFTEESLGDVFGVSRSIIRRVLARLSHQQVVILRPNHRPQVAAPDLEQTRQILHARRLAEQTLVRLACRRRSPRTCNSCAIWWSASANAWIVGSVARRYACPASFTCNWRPWPATRR